MALTSCELATVCSHCGLHCFGHQSPHLTSKTHKKHPQSNSHTHTHACRHTHTHIYTHTHTYRLMPTFLFLPINSAEKQNETKPNQFPITEMLHITSKTETETGRGKRLPNLCLEAAVPVVEFTYLVFARIPGESYRRRFTLLLLYLIRISSTD